MIRSLNRTACGVIALFLCVSLVSPVSGQITEGKTAFDNLKASQTTAPGTLVGQGVSRAQARVQLPFGGQDETGIPISQTERPESQLSAAYNTMLDAMLISVAAEVTRLITDLISSLFTGDLLTPGATTPDTTGGTGGATTPDTSTPDTTTPVDTTPDTGGGRDGGRRKAVGSR